MTDKNIKENSVADITNRTGELYISPETPTQTKSKSLKKLKRKTPGSSEIPSTATSKSTKFVISVIAKVPDELLSDSSSDSSSDEIDYPFTTKQIRKDNKLENFEDEPILQSKVIQPFLDKLEKTGFKKNDENIDAKSVCVSIALNKMRSLSSRRNKLLTNELNSEVKSNIKFEKFGFFWHCQWYYKDGMKANYEETVKFYKDLRKRDKAKARKFREDMEENNPELCVPYQYLREYAKNHKKTRTLVKGFRTDFQDSIIYLSLIDIDTVDFNGIYSEYYDIVKKRENPPRVMSTGYEYPKDSEYDDVFKLASQYDRKIRGIIAKEIPFGVYYPEPNTCILIPKGKDFLEESFINKKIPNFNLESPCLLKNIINKRNEDKYNFIFSSDHNPIITTIPYRAKQNKKGKLGNKPEINFSPDFKKGSSPTEDDFQKLSQISQSSLEIKVRNDNLFINCEIYCNNEKLKDFLEPSDKLDKIYENFLNSSYETTKTYREWLKHIKNNKAKIICSHLITEISKLVENSDKYKAMKKILEIFYEETAQNFIKISKNIKNYMKHIKLTLRSDEEKQLLELCEKNDIKLEYNLRSKLKSIRRGDKLYSKLNEIFKNFDDYDNVNLDLNEKVEFLLDPTSYVSHNLDKPEKVKCALNNFKEEIDVITIMRKLKGTSLDNFKKFLKNIGFNDDLNDNQQSDDKK